MTEDDQWWADKLIGALDTLIDGDYIILDKAATGNDIADYMVLTAEGKALATKLLQDARRERFQASEAALYDPNNPDMAVGMECAAWLVEQSYSPLDIFATYSLLSYATHLHLNLSWDAIPAKRETIDGFHRERRDIYG